MERKQHWENIYRHKQPGEVSWYQAEPRLSLELIERTGIPADAAIIDVGGGASVLVDRLLAQGRGRLAVLDISAAALEYAKARLGAEAAKVEWFEADVTRFNAPHVYELWHDRAVFHFLTAAGDRRAYVRVLERALAPGGHLIMAAFALGGPRQCSNLDIVQYDAAKLSAELGSAFTLVEERSEAHVTPADKVQQFGFFRFVRR